MLKHIPPILTPELLKVLMEMGHGDEIVIADGNFPGAAIAQRLIRLDGHGVPEILDAVMRFLPLDSYTEKPVGLMAVVPGDPVKPTIWEDYRCILDKHEPKRPEIEYMERFAFYERAKKAYAVIATGETAIYANILLKKGRCSAGGYGMNRYVLALDLGASSGRAMLAAYDGEKIRLREVHRFSNDPVAKDGRLYWNVPQLMREIEQGMQAACAL